MKTPIGMLALFCILLSTSACAQADSPAATLKVDTLQGKSFDLAAHRGNWVIVNFWATWCTPCIEEMPAISGFVDAHENVSAIGLAFEDTDKAEILAFLEKHPVVYPIAQVDVFDPPGSFEVPRGLPTTYLIAPDGSVAKKIVGPITASDLAKAIGIPAG